MKLITPLLCGTLRIANEKKIRYNKMKITKKEINKIKLIVEMKQDTISS